MVRRGMQEETNNFMVTEKSLADWEISLPVMVRHAEAQNDLES